MGVLPLHDPGDGLSEPWAHSLQRQIRKEKQLRSLGGDTLASAWYW